MDNLPRSEGKSTNDLISSKTMRRYALGNKIAKS
jgi:hypothetical protein